MPGPHTYITIERPGEGIYTDKGSKFIGLAFPVAGEDDVKQALRQVKSEYKAARHYCYAFVIGPGRELSRANDAGEPSGTAGKPILGQLTSFGVTNALVIVVRYFGGVLLGTGGLIQAYRNAAREALAHAGTVEKEITEIITVKVSHERYSGFITLLKKYDLKFHTLSSDETSVSLRIEIPVRFKAKLAEEMRSYEAPE